MKLQTQIPLYKQSDNLIDYNSNILLVGSCFAENMGNKFNYFKFQNVLNPFGILFHPIAIQTLLENVINKTVYSENSIFFHNEQWHCFEAHSKLSKVSQEDLLQELNKEILTTYNQLIKATHVIITLGTAWVYRLKETNSVVANCHKVPQNKFTKELLSIKAIEQSVLAIINYIRQVNTNAAVIFTISPVRHIKDGFVENTQSKAHLISAIHNIINAKPNKSHYFPAYEIMMDELRDYRFYDSDMLHPNQTAIDYIWEKFINVWLSDNAIKTMAVVSAINKGLLHKANNPNTQAHKTFLEELKFKQADLQNKYPQIHF